MLGEQLPFGQGVSWPTVTGQEQTYVEDVATREGVKMFRWEGEDCAKLNCAVPQAVPKYNRKQ